MIAQRLFVHCNRRNATPFRLCRAKLSFINGSSGGSDSFSESVKDREPSHFQNEEPRQIDHTIFETRGKVDPTKYGGIKKEIFIRNLERSGSFIRNVFDPKIIHISNAELTWSVEYKPHMNGNIGVPAINHGALSSLMENAAFFAAWASLTDKFERVRPIDTRIDHISHAPFEDFIVSARVYHRTVNVIRVDVGIWNSLKTKKPVTGQCNFAILTTPNDLEVVLAEREEKIEIARRATIARQQQQHKFDSDLIL